MNPFEIDSGQKATQRTFWHIGGQHWWPKPTRQPVAGIVGNWLRALEATSFLENWLPTVPATCYQHLRQLVSPRTGCRQCRQLVSETRSNWLPCLVLVLTLTCFALQKYENEKQRLFSYVLLFPLRSANGVKVLFEGIV